MIQHCRKKIIQLVLRKVIQNFSLSLHYNGADSYLFVNVKEIIKFKGKDSETVANSLC